ncbi:MAG: hypothetical protein ACRDZ4_17185 [Egibacteraceae bacterium]
MPGRPDLLDNLSDETTHAAELAYLIGDIANAYPLAVATGFINLGGLHELAQIVTDGRTVRLLLGAAPDPGLGAGLPLNRFDQALLLLS